MYVADVSEVPLQHTFAKVDTGVAKVGTDVAYIAMVIHVCCKSLFKIFYLFHRYVASALSGCCIYCNDYVASVSSKYFIYF
jgi:hypothetical protein